MSLEKVRVLARVRPSKHGRDKTAFLIEEKSIKAIGDRKPKNFEFDGVFGPTSHQADVFEGVGREVVDGVLSGINGTVFAYGQTGSGKTHTMMGHVHPNKQLPTHEKGLIPRCMEYLFASLETRQAKEPESSFNICCTFLELYNENLTDLLSKNGAPVVIRGDEKNMRLQGAKSVTITTVLEALNLIRAGFSNRQIAETAMNKESSRSHAIFIVDVVLETGNSGLLRRSSARLNFVDLAGSERQSATRCEGIRLKEAAKINQSLSTLALVIRKLSSGAKQHVPYRDSRLTLLLRDSLGGNSRTAVVVNLHPDIQYFADSLSTLQFAVMCGQISNSTTVNREIAGESVAALKAEIHRLTQELQISKTLAENEASETTKAAMDKLEEWKRRALEGQEAFASLRVELEFRMHISRARYSEDEASSLEEIKKAILANARSSLEDFDSAAAAGELQLLRSQLEDSRANTELLRQKLRHANHTQRLATLTQSPSPVVRLGSRLSQMNINSPPINLATPTINQTPLLREKSMNEIEGSSQFQMISLERLTELTDLNAQFEQEVEDQKKSLEEFKEQFAKREQEHAKEVANGLNKFSALEAIVAVMAAERKKSEDSRASLEEQRRLLEQRLADVAVQRDTFASELYSVQKENDEMAEKCQFLENQLEQEALNASVVEISEISLPRTFEQGVQVGGQDAIDELKERYEELRVDNWHKEMAIKQLEGDLEDQKDAVGSRGRFQRMRSAMIRWLFCLPSMMRSTKNLPSDQKKRNN